MKRYYLIFLISVVMLFSLGANGCNGDKEVSGTELKVPAPGNLDVKEMVVLEEDSTEDITKDKMVVETSRSKTVSVKMTGTGFSPSSITINKGDTVTFVDSGASRWPASNVHPTHTVYPGSSINKCNTGERSQIFDACGSVVEYSFTFNEIGSWRYHDHRSAGKGGMIIVE